MKYKAFISYRHSETSRLYAACLERDLEQYAKPLLRWPVNIFRDESDLRPGQELSKTIEEGLNESGFLIYLATKEAADSEWVQDELRIWCTQLKKSDKLIIVHLNDKIKYASVNKTIDWQNTDAIPRFLKEHIVYPLCVDLTWAKDKNDLDLHNIRYNEIINSISATLDNMTPEEKNGEAIKTTRKNILLRKIAVTIVVLALLIAIGFGIYAKIKRDEAISQRNIAVRQKEKADSTAVVAKNNENEAIIQKIEANRQKEKADSTAVVAKTNENEAIIQKNKAIRQTEIADSSSKVAKREEENAIRQASIAVARQLVSLAELKRTQDSSSNVNSVLLAIEALKRFENLRVNSLEANEVLRNGIFELKKSLDINEIWINFKTVALNSNGCFMATLNPSNKLEIWDVFTRKLVSIIQPQSQVNHMYLNDDGTILATVCMDDTIRIWDALKSELKFSIKKNGEVDNIIISPKNNIISVIGSKYLENHNSSFWSMNTGEKIDINIDKTPILFSLDNNYLITQDHQEYNKIEIWNLKTGSKIFDYSLSGLVDPNTGEWLEPDMLNFLAYRHGDFIATVSGNEVIVFNIKTLEKVSLLHSDIVTGIQFLPNTKNIISTCRDGAAYLWDVKSGQKLKRIKHGSPVIDIAISDCGDFFATVSSDKIIRVWNTKDYTENFRIIMYSYYKDSWIRNIHFSPDGKEIVILNHNMPMIFTLNSMNLIKEACSLLSRNMTLDDWYQAFNDLPYCKTCQNLPIHSSLAEYAEKLAEQGEWRSALALFKRIKEIEPGIGFDPKHKVATILIERSESNFEHMSEPSSQIVGDETLYTGNEKEAINLYIAAKSLDPSVELSREYWGHLCIFGLNMGLEGKHMDIYNKCAKGQPENLSDVMLLLSSGMANAKLGNYKEALRDFTAISENDLLLTYFDSSNTMDRTTIRTKINHWINILIKDINPITNEDIKEVEDWYYYEFVFH